MAIASIAIALSACGPSDRPPEGTIGFVEGFLGGVVADEPHAALAGRDALSAGGSAADAAVAAYFTLAVTMPSAASLGGGGVCLVYDPESEQVETLDFIARAPSRVPATATRPTAIPGNPRGFFALHAKYGRLPWAQLVAPAEEKARFGVPVSRAFARDLAEVGAALLVEPKTRQLFGRADGRSVLSEGEVFAQIELAAVLSQIRRQGPGELYAGSLTHRFIDETLAAGGSLSPEDLRNYTPIWRDSLRVPWGNHAVHFATPPGAAGTVAAQMWSVLVEDDRYEDAGPVERLHLLSEAAMRAFADRGVWLRSDGTSALPATDLLAEERLRRMMASYRSDRHTPAGSLDPAPAPTLENPSGTSFVAVDPDGAAVACTLTMNNLFGIGRFAGSTGILLAAAPGPAGRGPTSLGPALAINEATGIFYMAAAASGGGTVPTSLVNVLAGAMIAELPMDEAVGAKRVHHGGDPDIVFHEPGMAEDILAALRGRGHQLAPTPALGRVNIVYCDRGLPSNPESCAMRADLPPRGYGLAASAD